VRGVEIVEQFKTGLQNMAQLPAGFPDVYTAEQFKALPMPVQLMIGDHEVIYERKPSAVVEAARKVLPAVVVAWIENGGHAVTIDQADAANEQLLRFHCD
jgi:pimeloyl-ACP methyl ester carboxylesterase